MPPSCCSFKKSVVKSIAWSPGTESMLLYVRDRGLGNLSIMKLLILSTSAFSGLNTQREHMYSASCHREPKSAKTWLAKWNILDPGGAKHFLGSSIMQPVLSVCGSVPPPICNRNASNPICFCKVGLQLGQTSFSKESNGKSMHAEHNCKPLRTRMFKWSSRVFTYVFPQIRVFEGRSNDL